MPATEHYLLRLIPYPLLAGCIGLAYLLGDPIRTNTPSFVFAKSIAPMQAWGALFLVGAVVMAVAILTRRVLLMRLALLVGVGIYAWWGTLFLVSAATDPRASLAAWAIYGFLAFAHYLAHWRLTVGPLT